MKTIQLGLLAGLLLAWAGHTLPVEGAVPDGSGTATVFRLADNTTWGGQTLIASRPLYLTRKASAKLSSALPKGAALLYGTLDRMPVAQARLADGSLRVFLDTNGDGEFSLAEGMTLRKGVVRWPACADDQSGVAKVGERTAVVWACRAPNVLFWAWRGSLSGEVTLGGIRRPAFLVDGNANGKFGDAGGDLIWIDRNGDGLLDPAAEQFPWAPEIRIGGDLYRFAFDPAGTGGTARYSRVERALARRRITLPAAVAPRVLSLEGTLLSQADDLFRAERSGVLELPEGSYALTSLSLSLSPDGRPGDAWAYFFSRIAEGKDSKGFPLAINSREQGDLPLYQRLEFGMDAATASRPGGQFPVQLWARTELGLELTNARRAGQDESDFPGDFGTITLLDAAGRVLDEKRTGFA